MCGIIGVVQLDGRSVDLVELERGLHSLQHRGPDASCIWQHNNVALGHSRLSIIDISDSANQPMSDNYGRSIVFNGEIYNYRELKKQLEGNYTFKTSSDTEVILAAYNEWGRECVERFNGDWAFAIYDKEKNSLFLSRDRFGIKPLYYFLSNEKFIFASEIKALLALGVPARIKHETLLMLLRSARNEMGAETLFEDIHALPAAHNMIFSTGGALSIDEYWGEQELFGATCVPSSIEEATQSFGDLLTDSVRLRMNADVPVGVALSGGLDSSLICALADRVCGAPIKTFSGVARGFQSDESLYSSELARDLGSEHTEIDLGGSDFFSIIERFVFAQESPAATLNTFARYFVLERASKRVKVILDGQGGDELLCGYLRFNRIYNQAFNGNLEEKAVGSKNNLYPVLSEVKEKIRSKVKPKRPYHPRPLRNADPVTIAQYESLRGSGLLSLLHTEDRLSMIHSIEGRVPYLDHRLVEFCFSCPIEMRIGDSTKILIRNLARSEKLLPGSIVDRLDKKGFSSPYSELLRLDESFQGKFSEYLLDNCSLYKNLYDIRILKDLLSQHFTHRFDNSSRLIRSATIATFLSRFSVSMV